MEVKATAKYLRISPRKARQIVDLIRGKSAQEALTILQFIPKKSAEMVYKVLKSAVANAENNYNLDVDQLVVSKAFVDQGPTLKRVRPRAMGRGYLIRKRTSHITVAVSEKEEQ
ncbi:MAG TPA: 50S ribosomal protein L22 [Candidatus Atribacteria bacterium]|jgi:large subunit ribosomal protein L22|uniref:50S ribosomal protein L22 n=1 Tax=Candidatus Sordicultor fermentans TaxID=1953203 RepID=UPI0016A780B1|nr:50S ribosomal protein L22 [Atribacterota bacterium]NLY06177.1 50S ribosomal protein L22 [Candidatus Atribacteria bacterium]MDI9607801.1 50S ribosomal protein L22 [Atribacterota bacterium]MDY0134860.1 50S ribosomal protein L22 [Atribacterota bacterium]HOA98732.1 50S ribosomal protein L22 [Candidatus Atribacteria bacterium]